MIEQEAETFAVNLLAPMSIIKRLPSIQTKTDFMELCDLSGEASDNCIEELQMKKSGKKLPFPIKKKDVLHRLFFRFFNEFSRTEVPSLSCDDLKIDETFDDYIEFDYWDFTLMESESENSKRNCMLPLRAVWRCTTARTWSYL